MGKKILNLGCGNETYGTDRIDIKKTKATTKICDLENGLPFKENTFDIVYSKHLLEHIKNPFKLILEMKRVCKNKGKIIIITDNAGYIFYHIFIKNKNNYHGNHNKVSQYGKNFINEDRHYCLYSPEHLRNFYDKANIYISSNELSFENNISRRSLLKHKILNIILGERFSCPNVIIKGIKTE